ncbi:putative pH signal transduction protein PalI [Aspergillus ruber CBS 135680]|uniref:Pali-domain-containing protein n=1 Tax=Aspergillus ruber (strain CBS 135680) TaxID=1388766 RepID=A0A017SGJ3_ASPRC|nr:pali-domain-containing protein [Aspergillus ruber CBS 135680]EYE96078.1 pali-domain-containing protein [Aspergillus ruber CBS 135680]
MLFKPATPLTILLLIAFALLVLSVLSTPIVKQIPLASFDNVDYGVFGYCKDGVCTDIHIGYTSSDISNTGSSDFNLPSGTRRSLSSILIVHPVAAFLTLVCLCLAAAAHFHGPSHSPRYLLALLILLLPTLLVSLLAFLVDILLFVPHLHWGGWIVLVATVILVACGVVTCAMRRTLVSRKARKRRIAENAEMSGENYYNRQNAAAAALDDTKPEMNGDTKEAYVTDGPTADGPTFATFRTNTRESDDDQTPLNSQTPAPANDYPLPNQPLRNGMPYGAARDEVGNPLPPSGPYAAAGRGGSADPRMMNGGPPPGFASRGRGGYPPRGGYGRGGYGPPRGRGGPMGPMRGGPAMRGRGGYRGPPPADYGYDAYAAPAPRTHPTPPPAEYRGTSPVYRQPSPGIGMALSADGGPVGQAIEMTPQPRRSPGPDQIHALSVDGYPEPTSPSSFYSRTPSTYVPARAGWTQPDNRLGPSPSPSPVHAYRPPGGAHHARNDSTDYYEDVDLQFAENQPAVSAPPPALPSALMPGPAGEPKPVVEDIPEAPGSPTASEMSHFTSISQRPVNPRWQPPMQPAQQRTNMLLEGNPDFDLSAGRRRGGAGPGGRMPTLSTLREVTRYPVP